MKIVCAMVAKYADLAPDGAIHIHGGDLDTLNIQGDFPAVVPVPLYFAVKLAVPAAQSGRSHRTEVRLFAPGGEELATHVEPFDSPPSRNGRKTSYGFIITLIGLRFPTPGEYTFRMSVDGMELSTTTLYVNQFPPEPTEG